MQLGSSALFALTILATGGTLPALAQKSETKVKVTAAADKADAQGKQVVTVTLAMDKGWHAYANPVGNDGLTENQTTIALSAGGKAADARLDYPEGKLVPDKVTGDYRVYEDKVTIKATIQRKAGDASPLEVTANFQVCNATSCLLPSTVKVAVP